MPTAVVSVNVQVRPRRCSKTGARLFAQNNWSLQAFILMKATWLPLRPLAQFELQRLKCADLSVQVGRQLSCDYWRCKAKRNQVAKRVSRFQIAPWAGNFFGCCKMKPVLAPALLHPKVPPIRCISHWWQFLHFDSHTRLQYAASRLWRRILDSYRAPWSQLLSPPARLLIRGDKDIISHWSPVIPNLWHLRPPYLRKCHNVACPPHSLTSLATFSSLEIHSATLENYWLSELYFPCPRPLLVSLSAKMSLTGFCYAQVNRTAGDTRCETPHTTPCIVIGRNISFKIRRLADCPAVCGFPFNCASMLQQVCGAKEMAQGCIDHSFCRSWGHIQLHSLRNWPQVAHGFQNPSFITDTKISGFRQKFREIFIRHCSPPRSTHWMNICSVCPSLTVAPCISLINPTYDI